MPESTIKQQKENVVAVIGAGPAGMSAALWLKQLGFSPVVIEKEVQAGGMQRFNFLGNDWVLGQESLTGVQIADNFYRHIQAAEIDVRFGCSVKNIVAENEKIFLDVINDSGLNSVVNCRALIVAAGTRFVGYEILPSINSEALDESKKNDVIVEGPYAFLNLEKLSGKHIMIIGAGDNAFENAQLLLENNCKVTMVARSEPSAQKKFIDAVVNNPEFNLHHPGNIKTLSLMDDSLSVVLQEQHDTSISVDRLHILAGYQSNSDTVLNLVQGGFGKQLHCNAEGFIEVDQLGRTSVKGVYAAGDVCNPDFPCVVSAVASGALAAKTISRDFC